ncbi:ribosome maturation factor RimP [Actinotignum sp. GS-2025c]|uniref:ribosome maturation factor RimP n=1 Tax=Actinotignum sp. GS-2025c TaxID=3427276 RepID=UPI003F453617
MSHSKSSRPPARRDRRSTGPRKSSQAQRTGEIIAAIEPFVSQCGLYLEGVTVGRAGGRAVVQVTVDLPSGPGGVGSDQLTDVSRLISARLDDVDLVQGAYNLEVSTPGATRPLVEPRHFSRAVGRLLRLTPSGEDEIVTRLRAVEGDTLVLASDNGGAERRLPIGRVERARVDIEFHRDGEEE